MNVEATLVTFRFTDDNHEALESITINLKDLFAEYGYIPRTKAIPVEWLDKKYEENLTIWKTADTVEESFKASDVTMAIELITELWEKENETKTDRC